MTSTAVPVRTAPRPGRFVAACVVAGALALGGCAPAQPDLSDRAGADLRGAVLEVATAAAQGRYDAAAAAVGGVREALDRAAERGEISVQRYRAIDDALSRTEAELALVLDGLPDDDPVAEPSPEPAGEEPAVEPEPAPAEEAPAREAPAQPAPTGGDPPPAPDAAEPTSRGGPPEDKPGQGRGRDNGGGQGGPPWDRGRG